MKAMKVEQPTFGLISCTEDPIETVFAAWVQSRPTQYPELLKWIDEYYPGNNGVVTAKHVKRALEYSEQFDRMTDPEPVLTYDDVTNVFKDVTAMSIPVTESVHLTWGFKSMPIEWREQAVRKRQWGFWLTSMREFGMDDFVSSGRFAPPASDAVPDNGGVEFFYDFLRSCETAYNELKDKYGWPQEIARKVIPLCATHNGTAFSTLRVLLDTLAARSCWIAQVDLWAPVLTGIVSDLKRKGHFLGLVVSPPCFPRFSDEFTGCKFRTINKNRLTGDDPYAPCPLYCMNELSYADSDEGSWLRLLKKIGTQEQYITQGRRHLKVWSDIWHRDPFTGALK